MELFIALLALTAMEIVLGIDNIVFITIVSSKLPVEQQPLARRLGLILALLTRLGLLVLLFYMVNGKSFQEPVFNLSSLGIPESAIESLVGADDIPESVMEAMREDETLDVKAIEQVETAIHAEHVKEADGVSIKDIILFLGGLFLVGKSVYEIHDELGAEEHEVKPSKGLFVSVLIQIALLDIVFSLDSVITAVGMVENIYVMITAIVIAVGVMLIFSEPVSRFVDQNPTLKMLALSFLILIGVMLVAEGVGAHLDKGYIYFAMFFALIVEVLNILIRGKHEGPGKDSPNTAAE